MGGVKKSHRSKPVCMPSGASDLAYCWASQRYEFLFRLLLFVRVLQPGLPGRVATRGYGGFGVTTPLVSIVLSIFMAGLALGSWAGGRLMRSFEHRPAGFFISFYGAIELVIGLSVWWSRLCSRGTDITIGSGRILGVPQLLYCFRRLGGLVMLPFCTCMGATFPLAMAGIRLVSCQIPDFFQLLVLGECSRSDGRCHRISFLFIEMLGFLKLC